MDLPWFRRMSRRRFAGVAAVGALGVSRAAPAAARSEHMVQPWPAGRATPSLALRDLDGKRWNLAAMKGRPVLLNFWATWCEPCRTEMPSLERLAARHQGDGLGVISINYKESPETIRRFLETAPLGLPILLDPEGEATGLWTPRVFPATVLIDRNNLARQTVLGQINWQSGTASALIDRLLAPAWHA